MTVNMAQLEVAARLILEAIGEDLDRVGLVDTPRRFAKAWQEFIDYDPGALDTTFEATRADQMIVVRGIPLWSLCEHHLLPFSCTMAVGIIPRDSVLGLSKYARIAQRAAHRLQMQERLVEEVANDLEQISGSPDVAVTAEGLHLCLTTRGVRTPGVMVTSVMRGAFRDEPQTRAEFLGLARAST